MARSVEEIINDIGQFQPEGEDSFLLLDDLLDELFSTGSAASAIPCLVRLFERFPGEDGGGVMWSVVHGLESLPGYEPFVVDSVRRDPTEFSVLMVGRMLNSGAAQVSGIDLRRLLGEVANSRDAPGDVRKRAERFLEKLPADR
jgi:hypothetical protein